jgi:oligopeptide/dipeptide ABC transporter ATP-binding protein
VIEARGLTRTFARRGGMLARGSVQALRGVDITIPDRGAVSLIGESGCGKTTFGRILCGFEQFDGGDLIVNGQSLRALTVDPEVLVADEAVSMIDVSLRLGILQLLRELRDKVGMSVLFITHDVATARYVGEGGELYVIYRGLVIEQGTTETIIQAPAHPYTQALLSAVPVLRGIEQAGPDRVVPTGPLDERVESPGCLFEPRCPFAVADCSAGVPSLSQRGGTQQRHACLHPEHRSVVAVPVAGPAA